jgi:uncharacterized protein YdhG (YjbR/CyaY superfamily)
MKKTKSVTRRRETAASNRTAPVTVDEYIARVPEPGHTPLTKLRATIRSVLSHDATEIISYQIPAFRGDAGIIVWYAAFADHVSLFPHASVLREFKDQLTEFKVSKGTVQFPLDKRCRVRSSSGSSRHGLWSTTRSGAHDQQCCRRRGIRPGAI